MDGPDLVGRDDELAAIAGFLDDVPARGATLVLSGEAGIGKSVLLDRAGRMASTRAIAVRRSSGAEFTAVTGYGVARQLLAPLAASTQMSAHQRSALSPVLGARPEAVAVDRFVTFSAVLTLVKQAARDRPLLLVVDDLQWVDRSSAGLLHFIARRTAGTRAGLLIAQRPGPDGGPAAELTRRTLRALTDGDARDLVHRRHPGLAPAALRRVVAEARGSPLALVELPKALQADALVAYDPVLPLTRRLRDVFAARVHALPPPARRLLLLAALAGDGDLAMVRRAAPDASLTPLTPAEEGGLIRIPHPHVRIDFPHPLVRATVIEVAAPGERIAAHTALAAALASTPERAVWHLAQAATGPDESVAASLEETSILVGERGDVVHAVSLLLKSADLSPDGAARSRRLLRAAHLCAGVTGELDTAAQLLVEARQAEASVRNSLPAAVAAAALALNKHGDFQLAHRLLVDAIQEARTGTTRSSAGLADAREALAHVRLLAGAREDIDAEYRSATADLPPLPALHRLFVTIMLHYQRVSRQDLVALDHAITRLAHETDPATIVRIGHPAAFTDRAFAMRPVLVRLLENGRGGGAVASSMAALQLLCLDHWTTGEWDQAVRLAHEGLGLCRRHGYPLTGWVYRWVLGLVGAARGEADSAGYLAAETQDWATTHRSGAALFFARHTAALAALGAGDAERAYRDLTDVVPAGSLPDGQPGALWVTLDLVDAAVRTERMAEARAHLRAAAEARIDIISPRQRMLVKAAQALVAADHRTPELFEEALAAPGARRWPFDYARVALLHAEALHVRRDDGAARDRAATACEIFGGLGAAPWLARTAALMRSMGDAPGHPPAVRAVLTRQEREVAGLAATGLTNKQIAERLHLSARTVGTHLHNAYPKLGISTRTALRAALDRHETGDSRR